MSRQSILPLPDAQVSIFLRELTPLLDAYPAGATSHRPFVREFIRIVYQATGRTFNPQIYRKLLLVHAPGHRPSTDTLAQEKKAFDEARSIEGNARRQIDGQSGQELAYVVERAVAAAFVRQVGEKNVNFANADRYLQAQVDFLQARLIETEKMLNDVRTQAARLVGELQAEHGVRETLHTQMEAANALGLAQTQRIEQLTIELTGMRKFAMHAIDGCRGETRAQLERALHLESMLKTEKEHVEVFRRLAYRAGASIPTMSLSDGKS